MKTFAAFFRPLSIVLSGFCLLLSQITLGASSQICPKLFEPVITVGGFISLGAPAYAQIIFAKENDSSPDQLKLSKLIGASLVISVGGKQMRGQIMEVGKEWGSDYVLFRPYRGEHKTINRKEIDYIGKEVRSHLPLDVLGISQVSNFLEIGIAREVPLKLKDGKEYFIENMLITGDMVTKVKIRNAKSGRTKIVDIADLAGVSLEPQTVLNIFRGKTVTIYSEREDIYNAEITGFDESIHGTELLVKSDGRFNYRVPLETIKKIVGQDGFDKLDSWEKLTFNWLERSLKKADGRLPVLVLQNKTGKYEKITFTGFNVTAKSVNLNYEQADIFGDTHPKSDSLHFMLADSSLKFGDTMPALESIDPVLGERFIKIDRISLKKGQEIRLTVRDAKSNKPMPRIVKRVEIQRDMQGQIERDAWGEPSVLVIEKDGTTKIYPLSDIKDVNVLADLALESTDPVLGERLIKIDRISKIKSDELTLTVHDAKSNKPMHRIVKRVEIRRDMKGQIKRDASGDPSVLVIEKDGATKIYPLRDILDVKVWADYEPRAVPKK